MNLAISTVSSLSKSVQASSGKVVQMIDDQYSALIERIRVRKRRLELKHLMNKATTYSQWKAHAAEYDDLKSNYLACA